MHRTRNRTKPDPMVADRHARTLMANALLGFMQGRTYSHAFARAIDSGCKSTHDHSAIVLGMDLVSWLYDCYRDEPIRVNEEGREALCRAWVFLQTDLQYPKKFRWEQVKEYWPFASLAEWQAHEHLLPAMLPEYDAALAPPPSSDRMDQTRNETESAPMIADRCARTLLANALLGCLQGRLRSRAFEGVVGLVCKSTADESVMMLGGNFYSFYDGSRDRPARATTEEGREALCRAWTFLRTDLHCGCYSRWDGVREYWPFGSLEEWQAHQRLLPAALPEYDPALVPPQCIPPSEWRVWAPIIVLLGPVVIVILVGIFWWLWTIITR